MNRNTLMIGTMMAVAVRIPFAAAAAEWADSVKVKGDLRYRYEMIDEEGKDTRQRDRIRARFGIEGAVNENVKAVMQVSTGGEDPVSGNQTLSGAFSKKAFNLDLAYFEWKLAPELTLVGGKMKNPFMVVEDLIWDGDLNPEGLALRFSAGTDTVSLMANAGYLWVTERSGEDDDTMLYGGVAGVTVQLSDEVSLLVGGGYYTYDNMAGYGLLVDETKSFGNSKTTVGEGDEARDVYAIDYAMVDGFAQLDVWTAFAPIRVFGDYVVNTEADTEDSGYMIGCGLGKAKNPRTWELNYNYRELDKDAVVGAFTDSDSFGGGTDGKGHKLQAKYQIAKNWQFAATYFLDEKGKSKGGTDYDRLQVDLMAKF